MRSRHIHRILLWFVLLGGARPMAAYSLLTHEQLIDLTWQDSIVPLLLSRYPGLTAAELERARAYAYGGCVIQDIGYYPFGDASFSNLTHYVRSGDFVVGLFRNAGNANELAFAVGALSHYIGDSIGHSEATNIAVPVEFPALARKYGRAVSYAEGRHQHVQTEFAFDIDQIDRHRFAPLGFQRHVGLRVPLHQLSLAYFQTYGITDTFGRAGGRINVREYRFAVHNLIPRIADALALLNRKRQPQEISSPELDLMREQDATVAAENHWEVYRRSPGLGSYLIAGVLFAIPKFGPLSVLAVKGPTAQTEADYIQSLVRSAAVLRRSAALFTPPGPGSKASGPDAAAPAATQPWPANQPSSRLSAADLLALASFFGQSRDPAHPLPNRDLDTGRVVQLGGYPLTDRTYAALLHKLASRPGQPIPPGIKADIQNYFANPPSEASGAEPRKLWTRVQKDLATLAAMPTSQEPEPYPTYGDDRAIMK